MRDEKCRTKIRQRHFCVSNIPNCPLNPCQIFRVSAFNEHTKWSNQKISFEETPLNAQDGK